jgi:hypothetical protein
VSSPRCGELRQIDYVHLKGGARPAVLRAEHPAMAAARSAAALTVSVKDRDFRHLGRPSWRPGGGLAAEGERAAVAGLVGLAAEVDLAVGVAVDDQGEGDRGAGRVAGVVSTGAGRSLDR